MEYVLNDTDVVYRNIDLVVNEEKLGEITWKEVDGLMHMNHTYVSDVLRGQGIAKKLLDEAANYARKQNLKMNPICSYVVNAFEKYDEYNDVKV
jgi:uncharacterized protein